MLGTLSPGVSPSCTHLPLVFSLSKPILNATSGVATPCKAAWCDGPMFKSSFVFFFPIQEPCALVQAINLGFLIRKMGAVLVTMTKDPCGK